MENPFELFVHDPLKFFADQADSIKREIDGRVQDLEQQIRTAVEIAILRESMRWQLSRLVTLDPDHAADYRAALDLLGRS